MRSVLVKNARLCMYTYSADSTIYCETVEIVASEAEDVRQFLFVLVMLASKYVSVTFVQLATNGSPSIHHQSTLSCIQSTESLIHI